MSKRCPRCGHVTPIEASAILYHNHKRLYTVWWKSNVPRRMEVSEGERTFFHLFFLLTGFAFPFIGHCFAHSHAHQPSLGRQPRYPTPIFNTCTAEKEDLVPGVFFLPALLWWLHPVCSVHEIEFSHFDKTQHHRDRSGVCVFRGKKAKPATRNRR